MPTVTMNINGISMPHFEASMYAVPHLLCQYYEKKEDRNPRSLDKLMNVVCNYCEVTVELVASETRKREVVFARHLFFFLATHITSHTLGEIGDHIGGRDHTTVIHGRNKIAGFLHIEDPKTTQAIEKLAPQLVKHTAMMYAAARLNRVKQN
jgi:chromosomal replication initiation ATPase DnaA